VETAVVDQPGERIGVGEPPQVSLLIADEDEDDDGEHQPAAAEDDPVEVAVRHRPSDRDEPEQGKAKRSRRQQAAVRRSESSGAHGPAGEIRFCRVSSSPVLPQ
jgi:hypothetical protein